MDDKQPIRDWLKDEIKCELSRVEEDKEAFSVSLLNAKKEIRAETCIYRVPEKLRKLKEDAYSPRLVSIGPFHYINSSMSRHKYHYMSHLLQKMRHREDAEKCLDECIDAIVGLTDVIRQCYVEEISSSLDLERIMLVDGCFILELFLRLAPHLEYMMPHEYESDPLINNAWRIRALLHDLALLENQIPFFVLEILYDIIKPCVMSKGKAPESVTSLALSFFKPMMSQNSNIEEHSYPDCKHLLDLLHKSSLLAASGVGTAFTAYDVRDGRSRIALNHAAAANLTLVSQYWGLNYCAEELVQSGIELCKESEDSLVNITAMRLGQLIKIPPMFIDHIRDLLLRNLIAYEQSSINISPHVTSYVILMKTLIRSPRDVKLLRKKGIIFQYWIEDQEYITYFKSLLHQVFPKDFCFGYLCDEVNSYATKFWFCRKMSALYRTYFSTAWSMTSFIAAICLFILTVLQTYFTINPAR